VYLVLDESAHHVPRGALVEVDLDPGVRLGEAAEKLRDIEPSAGEQGADRDPAADHAVELVDLAAHALDLGEHRARPGGYRLAGLGGHDAAAGALEKLRPQLGLESADLVGERRLGDVELLRRAGEVAVAVHGLDVSELAQLHPIG
jgi:hypothetical protein